MKVYWFLLVIFFLTANADIMPPELVGNTQISSDFLEMTWSFVPQATGFEVAIAPKSAPTTFTIESLDSKVGSKKFEKLTACTDYIGMVRTVKVSEKSAWLKLEMKTGAGKPAPITSATFAGSDLTIVDTASRFSCADYTYVIKVYDNNDVLLSTQNTRQKVFTVGYLTANLVFKYKVFVEDLTTGMMSDAVSGTGTAPKTLKLDAPEGVMISAKDKQSVTLTWTAIAALVNYGVEVVKVSDLTSAGAEVTGTKNTGTFSGLSPCTLYSATVRGYTGTTATDYALRSIDIPFMTDGDETTIKPVLAVATKDLVSKNTIITITDTGVSVPCIEVGYQIELMSNGILVYQLQYVVGKEFYLNNLTPEREYTVTVTPVILSTKKAIAASAKTLKFTTLKEVNKYDKDVKELSLTSISKDTAIIAWKYSQPKPKGYLVTTTDSTGIVQHFTVEENAYIINSLKPCTKYSVNVYPIEDGNEMNVGKKSTELILTTEDPYIMPPLVVSLKKKSATEFEYNIVELLEKSCGQRKYYYKLLDFDTKDELMKNVITTKTGTITFTLYPTSYVLEVYAFTTDQSQRSVKVISNIVTEAQAGAALAAITNLKKVKSDQSSISLTWDAVATATEYTIVALRNDKYLRTTKTANPKLDMTGLSKCASYDFYVRASNGAGAYSPVALMKNIMTDGPNPLPIDTCTLHALSSTKIAVIIHDKPIYRCASAYFNVEIFEQTKSDSPVKKEKTHDINLTVDTLKPSTQYYAVVQVSGQYIGSESYEVRCNSITTLAAGAKEVPIPIPVYPNSFDYYIKIRLFSPNGDAFDPETSIMSFDFCKKIQPFLQAGELHVLFCNRIKVEKRSIVTLFVTFGTKQTYISQGRFQYACKKAEERLTDLEKNNIGFIVEWRKARIAKDLKKLDS